MEKAHNEYVNRIVQSIRELNDNGVQDSIVIGFDVYADRVKDSKNADIIASIENNPKAVALRKGVRITNDPNAPVVRIEPDLPPLDYYELRDRAKAKNPEIKFGKVFNEAMKVIKQDENLCKPNYLNPHEKTGQKKFFYDYKAIDVLISEYKRLEKLL